MTKDALMAERYRLREESRVVNATIRMHFDGIKACNDRIEELECAMDKIYDQLREAAAGQQQQEVAR